MLRCHHLYGNTADEGQVKVEYGLGRGGMRSDWSGDLQMLPYQCRCVETSRSKMTTTVNATAQSFTDFVDGRGRNKRRPTVSGRPRTALSEMAIVLKGAALL